MKKTVRQSPPDDATAISVPRDRGPDLARLVMSLHLLEVGHRRLRAEYAKRLGLSVSEYNALSKIGKTPQGTTPKEISSTLHMTTGATTTLIDRLQGAGLVQRRNNERDRRSVVVSTTAGGDAALAWAYREYCQVIEAATQSSRDLLEPRIVQLLFAAADAITSAADQIATATPSSLRNQLADL